MRPTATLSTPSSEGWVQPSPTFLALPQPISRPDSPSRRRAPCLALTPTKSSNRRTTPLARTLIYSAASSLCSPLYACHSAVQRSPVPPPTLSFTWRCAAQRERSVVPPLSRFPAVSTPRPPCRNQSIAYYSSVSRYRTACARVCVYVGPSKLSTHLPQRPLFGGSLNRRVSGDAARGKTDRPSP